jgi:ABC-type glycerol-3-phosphate transport system substrate-binding protein
MKRELACIVAAAALALLAACGGGGGSDAVAEELTAVPDSALASVETFSGWVGERPASETKDPLAMNSSAMPPSSETAEPREID